MCMWLRLHSGLAAACCVYLSALQEVCMQSAPTTFPSIMQCQLWAGVLRKELSSGLSATAGESLGESPSCYRIILIWLPAEVHAALLCFALPCLGAAMVNAAAVVGQNSTHAYGAPCILHHHHQSQTAHGSCLSVRACMHAHTRCALLSQSLQLIHHAALLGGCCCLAGLQG